jgi:hypothetical protein
LRCGFEPSLYVSLTPPAQRFAPGGAGSVVGVAAQLQSESTHVLMTAFQVGLDGGGKRASGGRKRLERRVAVV